MHQAGGGGGGVGRGEAVPPDGVACAAVALAAGRAAGPVWVAPSATGTAARGLEEARAAALAFLRELEGGEGRAPGEAGMVAAQAEMLDDPSLLARVRELAPGLGAEAAVRVAVEAFALALEGVDDPYLAARAHDVREVGDLWLEHMRGSDVETASPPVPSIVVAERLALGWLLAQPPGSVRAIVAHRATRTMHATIVASSRGIPVVAVEADDDFAACRGARRLLVDGTRGRVVLEPPAAHVAASADGAIVGPLRLGRTTIRVGANASDADEARAAREAGADGIVLVRTELAVERAGRLLTRDEQADLYAAIAQAMEGRPVTFRTLDLGADKPLRGVTPEGEPNPQLGVRGIRLYRRRPELLHEQLAALWRLAAARPGVQVMFPMVASPDDWAFCRAAMRQVVADVPATGPHRPRLGVMLEVPSALLWLPELIAAGVEFVSLGTNDLLQYFLAQDREAVDLPPPRVPLALLRLLDLALRGVARTGVEVAVCGEAAADPLLVPLLALVGVREFGVAPSRVGAVKRSLAALVRRRDWRSRLRPLLGCASDLEAERRLAAEAWWLDA